MKIEKIDHIHILVKDLEKAAKFFSDLMGTQFVGPIVLSDHSIAFDNAGLELVAPSSSETPEHMKRMEAREGLFSIGFKVPDLDEAITELESKGIKYTWKGQIPGLKAAQIKLDEYGVWIELVEYDNVPPVALACLDKTRDVPFFK
jgi:catechol 2,3-dioxygenase-like lactoylglutathione lyase family enzyme